MRKQEKKNQENNQKQKKFRDVAFKPTIFKQIPVEPKNDFKKKLEIFKSPFLNLLTTTLENG